MVGERLRLGRLQRLAARNAHDNHIPRDYSREKAYGVVEQPRALKIAMQQREAFIGKAEGDVNAFTVSRKAVNGNSYRRKFNDLGLPKKVADALYYEARRILRDVDGTENERMSVVSWNGGKVVTDTMGNPPALRRCGLDDRQYNALKGTPGGVALIHNHPASTRPSFADISSAADESVKASIVIGHDGSVWCLSDVRPDVIQAYQGIYDSKRATYSGTMSTEEIEGLSLNALYKSNGDNKWFRLTTL